MKSEAQTKERPYERNVKIQRVHATELFSNAITNQTSNNIVVLTLNRTQSILKCSKKTKELECDEITLFNG